MNTNLENSIAANLINIYERYGFKKIKLSKFEDYNLYNENKDFLQTEHILTFMNLNGNLKSLRPDVTLSIVKNSINEKETQKVYYMEDIYKIVSNEYEEIPQVGVETIGKLNNYSNLEIISMAIESLKSINENYILEISNIDFMSSVLNKINIEENIKFEILNDIYRKNKHDLEKLLNKSLNKNGEYIKIILSFIELSGNYKDILKKLKPLIISEEMQKSYEELESLSAVFELYDNFDKILIDFSIENRLGYYNGIIFRGYIEGNNDIILSGGRYDKLLNKFNSKSDKNAVGFAIYMDKLYGQANINDYIDILILYKSGDEKILLNKVRQLMNENKKVRVDIYGCGAVLNYKEKYIFDKNNFVKD